MSIKDWYPNYSLKELNFFSPDINIYSKKQRWKFFLLLTAVGIAFVSSWYTDQLVTKLRLEEKKKVELWAEGTKQLADLEVETCDISFLFDVIKNNTTVPVILTDEKETPISYRNLDTAKASKASYLKEQLKIMKLQHPPITIYLYKDQRNYIFYKDSILLTQLRYYPIFQLFVIGLFLIVAYFAFNSSRNAEQNQVWIGMAKETAHQLGTPLSSLMAWVEIMKLRGMDEETAVEVEKDISRLQTITERFSKIGSKPALHKVELLPILENSVNYIKRRTSSKIDFSIKNMQTATVSVPLNIPLFEWVIENLCKNAVDAMENKGSIVVSLTDQKQFVYIDIADTGKGMAKSRFKTVFKPGYTTKSRGWGLGLSLAKRIIENYHAGQIFVKASEIGKGTTFRIVLKKNLS
jgi:nitrogen-specific signal transduction histidine kinase